MKIKTITCHDVYNVGASLQAYALAEYLKELGDVYKRGLLEVDGFIQEYIKQEGENDDL